MQEAGGLCACASEVPPCPRRWHGWSPRGKDSTLVSFSHMGTRAPGWLRASLVPCLSSLLQFCRWGQRVILPTCPDLGAIVSGGKPSFSECEDPATRETQLPVESACLLNQPFSRETLSHKQFRNFIPTDPERLRGPRRLISIQEGGSKCCLEVADFGVQIPRVFASSPRSAQL